MGQSFVQVDSYAGGQIVEQHRQPELEQYKKKLLKNKLGSEEVALKTLQDGCELTESLEAIKSKESRRIQKQGLSLAINKLVSKLKNGKLFGNSREIDRLSGGRFSKEKMPKERLAAIASNQAKSRLVKN